MPGAMKHARVIQHVLSCLSRHRARHAAGRVPPLFVAVQGPQGSGKTFLANRIRDVLGRSPHQLAVAVLSIDDLYLPRKGLLEVGESHPHNPLLNGRGLPGTHDIPLGTRLLKELKRINEPGASSVHLPSFDKSLFGGYGDRSESVTVVNSPLDVVVLEGWFVGFCPVSQEDLHRRHELSIPDLDGLLDINSIKKETIAEINEMLWDYVEWWTFFDAFVQIRPPSSRPYSLIYEWRLQQEHNMKSLNGGRGMTDEQVKAFVDRYIPAYIYFADGVKRGYVVKDGTVKTPAWIGSGVAITIGEDRDMLAADTF